ncbi:helix-turn-helix domain-containing protein [Paenibacillus polymyxa]|uniref:helix-turn-helix domain-containing protein n=1 Tax=Paenibacillus polymyxa TaxID=1406 RepID=UPI0009B79D51
MMIQNKLNILMSEKKIRNISELARETELDRRTLTNIYDEKNKGIDYVTLNKLCAYFNCTVADLLEYVPDED